MTNSLSFLAAVTAAVLAVSAPAFANSQLAANAGLTSAEAEGLSLTEIAIAKFNRNADHDDRQVVVMAGMGGDWSQLAASAGLSPDAARGLTLNEVFVAKINREADHDDRQGPALGGGVSAMTRSPAAGAAWSQLAASAGLTPDEAAGMTLTEIAIAKFNRNADHDDRQGPATY